MNRFRQQFDSFLPTFRRELGAYFATPMAYVFLAVFLLSIGMFTWEAARFFDTGTADLSPFFVWHPWIYMIFLPALAMRLWADETSAGTDELLLSLPLGMPGLVLGKLCAAWTVAAVGLVLTLPMWITVNVLGDPDNGVILAGYLGSFLMAGAFLAIGSCISALTKNQVIAFIVAATVCFLFTMSGLELVLNFFQAWAPELLVRTVASMSFLTHFTAIMKGVIELRDLVFFASLIAFWLFVNIVVIDLKKAS